MKCQYTISFAHRSFFICTIIVGLVILIAIPRDYNVQFAYQTPQIFLSIENQTPSKQRSVPDNHQNAIPAKVKINQPNIDFFPNKSSPNQPSSVPSQILHVLDPNNTSRNCPSLSPLLWSQKPTQFGQAISPFCSVLLNTSIQTTSNGYSAMSAMAKRWVPPNAHNESSLLELVSNCTNFRHSLSFPTKPASNEEAEYPLAYVFMANRNAAQTIRLFRMIYQPQNVYCIAYDTKGDLDYIQTILAMASCFPSNVFINPKPEKIYYFGYSILRSVMNCMTVLNESPVPWKYVQVVSWNDFPLRTNLEMVRIFKILNGSQDCELIVNDEPKHVTHKWAPPNYYKSRNDAQRRPKRRRLPPDGLTLYKGSFATSMTREFVEWMFTNPTSIKLYKYFYDSKGAEEWYWPTLIHNIQLKAPGGFPGQCQVFYSGFQEKKPFLSRFQVWKWDKGERKCKGKVRWYSCIYGVLDLPMLLTRVELIAHKLYEEYQPALLYCLEEWYWQKVCTGDGQLDWSFYYNLPSVKYHNMPDDEKENYICKL